MPGSIQITVIFFQASEMLLLMNSKVFENLFALKAFDMYIIEFYWLDSSISSS